MNILRKYSLLISLIPGILLGLLVTQGHIGLSLLWSALFFYAASLLVIHQKLYWLALFVLSLLPMLSITIINQQNQRQHQPFSFLEILIFLVIFLFALILSYRIARKKELIEPIHISRFPLGKILIGFLMIFVASLLTSFIGSLLKETGTENQAALNQLATAIPTIVYAIAVVGAGFFEELTYRVAIMDGVLKKYQPLAFLAALLLFTLMHSPSNIYSWLTYGLMSLILTTFYYRYRNFYLNMGIHMLWNGFGILISLLVR
ncbi:type II CAAX endopeptidase family protein [Lactococcus termiticola]|uniref:CAAX prenyl protease 2/Lysostaphin resistance protein A-like domain-containing protein n=1 Tax=Lactococcus termiticola TaxID=2169526 RepID=A0A2R5HJ56_9LACT|nr:type II CAAX endopeptidase family protein [Lactococcus termiticola]GBG96530.1 hypothetical protein NtB2_00643 [Lactococcus termiticola]